MAKVTKAQIKKERDPIKLAKVLEKKGYPKGLPKGKEAHHVKPVSEGGKTNTKNIRVISASKHKEIHANREKRGLV